ncbi:major facilitator superfamily domain-containing protein [Mycena pura]|uniref:Major facilitator superfamily domain-containing protein n=1 Tax=Mycena pura TaxID=153505 RepID=A0AAD6V6N4_9AGAR|nr:major facilitator superfamily domain-containing protein [Mycena pura]
MAELSLVQSHHILPAEAKLPGAGAPPRVEPVAVVREKRTSTDALVTADSELVAHAAEWTYPDGGLRAWLVVLGCFIMASTCMAWGLVWGVFEDYYRSNKFAGTSLSTLSLVGGVYSFVFLFQGCLLGLSWGISMPLYMALPSQWFLRKRGLATGIAIAGSGMGGAAWSLVVRSLLSNLGYRNTMLVYSNLYAVLWTIAWFLIAERRPAGYRDIQKRWLPQNTGPVFYSIALSVFVGIFGYLSPYYFITTYVKSQVPSLDPESILVVVPLVLMNLSGGFGRILAGRMADRLGSINMFFTSFFLGGLAQIFIWTFAHSYAAVLVFSVIYGLVGGWFLNLIPVVCAQLFGLNDLATITGFMVLVNAPGQLSGASIGGAVFSASGGNWRAVSLYSGCMMLVGSCFVLFARFSHDKRVWVKI